MKKILAVLLALVAIGGLVFAEDAAPAPVALADILTKAPAVTFGADAGFGTSVLAPLSTTTGSLNSDGTLDVKDVMNVGGSYFYAVPWFTFDWSGFAFTGKMYYSPQNGTSGMLPYIGANPASITGQVLYEGNVTYTFGGLTLSNTVDYDPDSIAAAIPSLAFDVGSYTFQSDNVEAKLGTYAEYVQTNGLNPADGIFLGTQITDAYLKINNIFNVLSVKVGGTGSNYLRLKSLNASGSPYYYNFASQTNIGRFRIRANGVAGTFGTPYIFDVNNIGVVNTLAFADLGLTVYGAFNVPTTGPGLPTWLAGNNMVFAAKYALKDIGTVDAGWLPAFGYDKGLQVSGAIYTKGDKQTASNSFFADFQLTAVDKLTALVGLDLTMGNYEKKAASTGTGTLADPIVKAGYLNYMSTNIGLEAKYDLGDVVKGLSILATAYVNLNSGKTYNDAVAATDTTFAQYLDATYPTATFFRMASLTEASWLMHNGSYAAANPFKFYLKANWDINDTLGVYFKNNFIANAGWLDGSSYYAGATKDPVGYYNTDKITLGTNITAGKGTIGLEFGYTLYLGLPSASDLGYTDSTVAGAYKSAAEQCLYESPAKDPWSLDITYSISF